MKTFQPIRASLVAVVGVLLSLTACDAPQRDEVPSAPQFSSVASPTLLQCPSNGEVATERQVGLIGGLVSLAGNMVLVPAEAVLGPMDIEIAVPASRHMVVELTANGQEHWQFNAPIWVTIDYSRCDIGLLAPPVSVWHIDDTTGEPLEYMGGLDNRLLRRVTFSTDHFSGYAIAN